MDNRKKLFAGFKYQLIEGSGFGLGSDHLMIVLHGQGDSARPFRHFNEEIGVPGLNLLLLNAPKPFLGGFSWYDDPPKQDAQMVVLRSRLKLVLSDLQKMGWSSEKIFIFGFSQGAFVGSDLVLHSPNQLAAFIGVSGYFNFYPRWRHHMILNETPFALYHGFLDKVLPMQETKFGARKLVSMGVQVFWKESRRGHLMTSEETKSIGTFVRFKCRGGVRESVPAKYPKVQGSVLLLDRWS